MSLKIITVGNRTDHGGTVISGSPSHDVPGCAPVRSMALAKFDDMEEELNKWLLLMDDSVKAIANRQAMKGQIAIYRLPGFPVI